jgi:hypothetical protein
MGIPVSFTSTIIFFNRSFEYSDSGIFKLLKWTQNLHQSTWNHEIVCADRPSEDEHFLIRPIMRKIKKYEQGGWLKVKIHI